MSQADVKNTRCHQSEVPSQSELCGKKYSEDGVPAAQVRQSQEVSGRETGGERGAIFSDHDDDAFSGRRGWGRGFPYCDSSLAEGETEGERMPDQYAEYAHARHIVFD
jgi:hypothetical protein